MWAAAMFAEVKFLLFESTARMPVILILGGGGHQQMRRPAGLVGLPRAQGHSLIMGPWPQWERVQQREWEKFCHQLLGGGRGDGKEEPRGH